MGSFSAVRGPFQHVVQAQAGSGIERRGGVELLQEGHDGLVLGAGREMRQAHFERAGLRFGSQAGG